MTLPVRRALPKRTVVIAANTFWTVPNSSTLVPKPGPPLVPWAPTGYLHPLQGSWGGFISSTLSIPLLRRRRGYWNVGLYFGDLFFVPFIDAALGRDEQLQLSFGGTLQLETKRPRNDRPPGSLRITVGMNLDSELVILFGFGKTELLFENYEPMSPCRSPASAID